MTAFVVVIIVVVVIVVVVGVVCCGVVVVVVLVAVVVVVLCHLLAEAHSSKLSHCLLQMCNLSSKLRKVMSKLGGGEGLFEACVWFAPQKQVA